MVVVAVVAAGAGVVQEAESNKLKCNLCAREVFDAKKLYRCRCDKSIQYYFSHVSGDPVSVVTMTWIPVFAGTRKTK